LVSFCGVFYCYLLDDAARRIHSRLPELPRVHFSQTLIALNSDFIRFLLFVCLAFLAFFISFFIFFDYFNIFAFIIFFTDFNRLFDAAAELKNYFFFFFIAVSIVNGRAFL